GPPTPPHTSLVHGPRPRRDMRLQDAEHAPAAAEQVDFHETDTRILQFLLLAAVLVLALTGQLVGQAEDLDHRNQALPRSRLEDIQVGFRGRLAATFHNDRLDYGGP